MNEHNPVLDWILLTIGAASGIIGENLDYVDKVLGIVLKVVSIVSFLTVIMLNWKKIREWVGR